MPSTPPHKLRIGVMMEEVQLADICCIDVLGNISSEYVGGGAALFAGRPDLSDKGIEMEWNGTTCRPRSKPRRSQPSVRVVPTVTYDDAPRDLDILVVDGPKPSFRPAAADRYLKEAVGRTGGGDDDDGKRGTTNREALGLARWLYPETEWVDERWVVDGNLWTSGGAGAGIDMLATYALENFDQDLVTTMALRLLDFDPKPRGKLYQ